MDSIGQGTFGQVVKCYHSRSEQEVAVKVVKNKLAYTKQGLLEIEILKILNAQDKEDKANIVKMFDCFTFKNHVCLVFELLGLNLFQVIEKNNYHGLSVNLIRAITIQMMDALVFTKNVHIIHCTQSFFLLFSRHEILTFLHR